MNEMKDLPSGWSIAKLEDVCEIFDNKRVPINGDEREIRISGKKINELYPYYGATGQVGYIDDYLLEDEYILLGEDGAPFLDPFKVKAYIVSGKIWVNNHAHILKAKILNKLVSHYLNRFNYRGFVTGTTRLKLNQSSMKNIPIKVPPLPEQYRIVAKIEELFSELDKGVESLKTAQQQLKVYRQAVLKWAFEGKLTEEWRRENSIRNDSWTSKRLGEYIEKIEAGKSFKCIERPPVNVDIGVVKVSAVTWGVYDENESKTCPDTNRVKQEYFIKSGDFLFSRANTLQLVGACVIANKVEKNIMLSDKILRITFCNIIPKYCLYYLRSKKGRDEIERLATGNQESMRNIGQDRIKMININICSLDEQAKIVQEIESRLSVCDKMEEAIQKSLEQAEALRQSILKKAFEGKLVPQDPNDEPAEKLLERIRLENQNSTTKPTKKKAKGAVK